MRVLVLLLFCLFVVTIACLFLSFFFPPPPSFTCSLSTRGSTKDAREWKRGGSLCTQSHRLKKKKEKKQRPAIISGCRITTLLRGTYPCIHVCAYPTRPKHQSEEADLSPKRAGMSVMYVRDLVERDMGALSETLWPWRVTSLYRSSFINGALLPFAADILLSLSLSLCFFTLFFLCLHFIDAHAHTHVPLTLIIVRHLCPSWPLHKHTQKKKKGGINIYASTT